MPNWKKSFLISELEFVEETKHPRLFGFQYKSCNCAKSEIKVAPIHKWTRNPLSIGKGIREEVRRKSKNSSKDRAREARINISRKVNAGG